MTNHLIYLRRWLSVFGAACAASQFGIATFATEQTGRAELDYGKREEARLRWTIVGPFETENGDAMERDFLAEIGSSESRASECAIDELTGLRVNGEIFGKVVDATRADTIDLGMLFRKPMPTGKRQMACYARLNFTRSAASCIYLLLGSDDGAEVWFNGKLCRPPIAPQGRDLRKYDNIVSLNCHEGTNHLLVKIVNRGGGWQFACEIAENPSAAVMTALTAAAKTYGSETFLRRFIYEPGQDIEIEINDWPNGATAMLEFEALDTHEKKMYTVDGNRLHATLSPGLYTVHLVGGADGERSLATGRVYIGECAKLLDLCRELFDSGGDGIREMDAAAYRRRIAILCDAWSKSSAQAESRADERYTLDMKLQHTVGRLERISRGGREAYYEVPGLHLVAFRSVVDDQSQFYKIWVPHAYQRGRPIPLLVIPPTAVGKPRPYLESPFMADFYSSAKMGELAEKLNMLVVWPGYRGQLTGSAIDYFHEDEVWRAVTARYSVDYSRVYMYAFSTACVVAAGQMALHPERYAAAVFQDAFLHRRAHRYDGGYIPIENEIYRKYITRSDPFDGLLDHLACPVFLKNNATDPAHVSLIGEEIDFAVRARERHTAAEVQFERHPLEDSADWRALNWLRQHRREGATAVTAWKLPDTVSVALAARFLVVEPTSGSAVELSAQRAIVAQFAEAWRKRNFGNCRILRDIDVTAADERESNLVLVGNQRTNRLWAKLVTMGMQAECSEEEVKIGRRITSGRGLCIQARLEHPLFRRSIVLIGGASSGRLRFDSVDLAVDGWFDVAIWQVDENGKSRLVECRAAGGEPAE